MNHALRRVSLACLAMFLLLLVNANYVQGFEAGKLADDPGNGRTFAQQYQYQRGSIITADNVPIAQSKHISGVYSFQRYYPAGATYAPVTGYDTPYSKTGIEQAEDKLLAGTDPRLAVRNLIDLVTGKPRKGATVQLTINSAAQKAAYQALKATGLPGGAVAIDPSTGAILALASYPSFNPNKLATLNGNALNKADKKYLNSPQQPLLNRAINETFPPGSTFKVVTGSTAFSSGKYNPDSRYYAPTNLKLPGTTHQLINFDNMPCNDGSNPTGNGKVPLIYAFTVSCNTVFGGLGMKLGGSALRHQANAFGMNTGTEDPAQGLSEPVPARFQPGLHRLLGDRPVQRHGDPVAGGDVLGGDREPRHADAPLPGAEGDRPEPEHAGDHPAQRAEAHGEPGRGRAGGQDDGRRGRPAVRHRAQHGRQPRRHHGRGEDGNGAERGQQHRPRRRRVHRFRASCQPTDSRRRRGKGRWSRRRRLSSGGSSDHQGIHQLPELVGKAMNAPDQWWTTIQDGYEKCET